MSSIPRLAVLAAALSLAACASGRPYVGASLGYSDLRVARLESRTVVLPVNASGAIETITTTENVERNESPYARIAAGYEARLSARLIVGCEISHTSSIVTGRDDGFNLFTLGVRWYPFD